MNTNKTRILFVLFVLFVANVFPAQPKPVQKDPETNNLTESFDLPTGKEIHAEIGSTFDVDGTLNGSPTGGTLDLSLITLTLPSATSGLFQLQDAALTALAAGSDFVQFTGPATSIKVFTLPDVSATLLYSGGALGTPSSGVATNLTGTASGLTAGNVTTNANLTGDVTSVGNATTLATVNGNVGSFGSATQASVVTVNAKGQVTAASNATVTPAVGNITGLGTGVASALAATANAASGIVAYNSSGRVELSGAIAGDRAPLEVTNTLDFDYVNTANFLAPNLTAGRHVSFNVGVARSTGNLATFGFKYAGSNNAANAFTVAFYGYGDVFEVRRDGAGSITGALTAGSFVGAGSAITSLNANNLASGTVANARLDADLQTFADITPGTGVGTALAVNVGTDGAFVVKGGALGTPSSGVATNLTGVATGLTAGAVRQLDLFLGAGQSNAVGQGTSASAPTPDPAFAYLYDDGGNITTITDPVDSAGTGSMWPQFAVDYHRMTGRVVGLATFARSGSTQVDDADVGSGNWDTTGDHYDDAKAHLDAAIAAFEAAGWKVNVRGVIWSQGETDAAAINTATITATDYGTALATMLGRWRTDYGEDFYFWCVRTGTNPGLSDTGFAAIRNEQEKRAAVDPRFIIATRETLNFPNLSMMGSGSHYNQAGLNRAGSGAARAAAGAYWNATHYVESVIPVASAVNLASSGTTYDITSITLGEGQWMVTGSASFAAAAGTVFSTVTGAYSLTTATLPSNDLSWKVGDAVTYAASTTQRKTLPTVLIEVNEPTTVYLVANGSFTVSTASAYGAIRAWRLPIVKSP
jgi:hypothetical protein